MDRQAHWRNAYTTKPEDKLGWYEDTPSVSIELITAVAGPGASVIDVGGGASRLVDRLVADGYRMTVLDVTGAALAIAEARMGDAARSVDWVVADVTAWTPRRTFTVWHDRAVFHFLLKPEDRQGYLAAMSRALDVGGHAIIGTFAPDGPERCSGLPVKRYAPDDLAAECGDRFERVQDLRHDHVTPGGTVQHFQFTVLRKVS